MKELLLKHYPWLQIKIIGIKTLGDKILDKSLAKIGGKGLFIKELEAQILDGSADIAVHSMKDVTAHLPENLAIAAILPRANPFDVLISNPGYDLTTLPPKAVVGTSSFRRQAQILTIRPDLIIKPLRGNVDTRLKKLKQGEFDAIILAKAGIDRLDLNQISGYVFSPIEMLPAVGQGAIGIEYHKQNSLIKELLAPLNDEQTWNCVQAERSMNAILNGNCNIPIAGFAEYVEKQPSPQLKLTAMVAHVDGSKVITASKTGEPLAATEIGIQVANSLLAQGADQILCVY